MFSLLDRYIGKTVMKVILLTLFLLISLSGMIRFIEQIRGVKGNYDLYYAAIYTLFTIPKDIEVFLPIATLIGSLIGLGLLAAKSELVVMETAGFSRYRIALATLKTAILLSFIAMFISEYVMPASDQYARNLKMEKSYGRSMLQGTNNFWAKDKNSFIFIGGINPNNSLHDLKIFETHNNKLTHLTFADNAVYEKNQWKLNQVKILNFTDPLQITETKKESMDWNASLTLDELNLVSQDPNSLSATGLYQYANYLESTAQNDSYYRLLFWQKIFEPISIAVMVLLALSYIFGPLRSVSMGVRVISGITTGFVFYILNNFCSQLSLVIGLPPIIGALITNFVFVLIALFLFHRSNT